MRWMLGAVGIAAAAMAVLIIRLWNRRGSKKPRGEVSVVAAVQRKGHLEDGRSALEFVELNGEKYRFAVPENVAQELEVGQQGVLTFQKGEFVYFVRKENLIPQRQAALCVS